MSLDSGDAGMRELYLEAPFTAQILPEQRAQLSVVVNDEQPHRPPL
jgi:hypothetical protein